MTRLGAALRRIDLRLPGVELPLMSVSQTRGVIRRSELTEAPARAESLDVYKVVRQGEIAFNKMSIRAGALGVAPEDGLVTYHYEVMAARPDSSARFLVYLMKSDWFIAELVKRERGIGAGDQANVRTTEVPFRVLRTIDAWLPSRTTQVHIADYLDRETAKIDALIEKQNALIVRLRERRVTVTWATALGQARRPEDVRDWFGTPPSGWTVEKLGRHCRIVNGSTPSRENPGYWFDGTHPWLNSSSANLGLVEDADQFVTDLALSECHLPSLLPGAVLLGITGQGRTRGMATLLNIEATINQHLAAIVPDTRYWDPNYLVQVMRAAYSELRFISDQGGSTKGALTCADVHAFRVPRPPKEEQRVIADRLGREIGEMDQLIAKAERFVELVRERRSALITAAVTGQVDVAGVVAA